MRTTERRWRTTLRFDIIDPLAAGLGATTNVARADLFEMHRSNLIRLRNGGTPSLDVAMDIAARLETTVEKIVKRWPADRDEAAA